VDESERHNTLNNYWGPQPAEEEEGPPGGGGWLSSPDQWKDFFKELVRQVDELVDELPSCQETFQGCGRIPTHSTIST
jgi:hypothetical protein